MATNFSAPAPFSAPPLQPGGFGMYAPPAPMAAPISAPASSLSGLLSSFTGGLSGLSGIASAGLNAFLQYNAYNAERNFLNFQQKQYGLQSKAQDLQARSQAIQIRNQAEEAIGKAKALFARRGVTIGLGTAQDAVEASRINANEDIENLMFGNNLQQSSLKAESAMIGSKKSLRGIARLQKFGSLLEGYAGSTTALNKIGTIKNQEEESDFYNYGF